MGRVLEEEKELDFNLTLMILDVLRTIHVTCGRYMRNLYPCNERINFLNICVTEWLGGFQLLWISLILLSYIYKGSCVNSF